MSPGNDRHDREQSAYWVAACFRCGPGPGPHLLAFQAEDGAAPREVARQWMVTHVAQSGHSDLMIVCGMLGDGRWLDCLLPQQVLSEQARRVLLDNAALFARRVSRGMALSGRQYTEIRLPGGYLIEVVDGVLDAVTARMALGSADGD